VSRVCLALVCAVVAGGAPAHGTDARDGLRFGVNDNSVGIGLAGPSAVMRRLDELGAPGGAVYRFTVDWRNIEPVDDRWDWHAYDAVYEAAVEQGLRPLPILLNSPNWAKGRAGWCGPHTGICISPPDRTPEALAEWQEFAAEAARRWPRAVAIEVWNEPNLHAFWKTRAGPDPAHFGELLCAAYDAIKGVDPGRTVVSGGLANPVTDARQRTMSQRDFLRALYEQGGARRCNDALGLHPYPQQRRPDGAGSAFLDSLDGARAEMAVHGDAGRRIWITEVGYHTGLPRPLAPAGDRPVTEDEQARWLTCAYRLAAAMPDVDAFLVHTLFDPGLRLTYREHNFGLNRHPRSPRESRKPAHSAFADLFRRHPAGVPGVRRCG
jgi:hypothetical protein